MITREQVADLRPGDVVEYSGHRDLRGAKLVGPVRERGGLFVADYLVRGVDDSPPAGPWGDPVLTIVSRAPSPLYVNHNRAEPVSGDVVRDADSEGARHWMYAHPGDSEPWVTFGSGAWWRERADLPDRLRLLVDGETGQVVQ